jgi:hypothetical protein
MFIDDQLLSAKSSEVGCVGMMQEDRVDHEGVDVRDRSDREKRRTLVLGRQDGGKFGVEDAIDGDALGGFDVERRHALAASKSSEKVGEEVVEAQQVSIIGDDWDGDRHAIEDTAML